MPIEDVRRQDEMLSGAINRGKNARGRKSSLDDAWERAHGLSQMRLALYEKAKRPKPRIMRVRQLPLESLLRAAEYVDVLGGKRIVEIGGMAVEPDNPRFVMYGGSTFIWAAHTCADEIYSIDVAPEVAARVAKYPELHPEVKAVVGDGLEVLATWGGGEIDLLYLDAWDVPKNLHDLDYQEKHLSAFVMAVPHMAEKSCILIDDTDIREGGKGRLVVPEAERQGWRVLWKGRQTMLVNHDPEEEWLGSWKEEKPE
jgi:predicted O-methyltransferase YrrM